MDRHTWVWLAVMIFLIVASAYCMKEYVDIVIIPALQQPIDWSNVSHIESVI